MASGPACGGAVQNPLSMLSECQLPLKPPGRIAVEANGGYPPSLPDAAETKPRTIYLQRTSELSRMADLAVQYRLGLLFGQ